MKKETLRKHFITILKLFSRLGHLSVNHSDDFDICIGWELRFKGMEKYGIEKVRSIFKKEASIASKYRKFLTEFA